MFDQYTAQGARAALAHFGLKLADVHAPPPPPPTPRPTKEWDWSAKAPTPAPASGILDKAKAFGTGQVGAAKDLFHNLRGGLGGQFHPSVGGADFKPPPGFDPGLGKAMHRQQAVGNIKTLAPSLLAGGGLYMMHRHKKQKEQQQMQMQMQQQQMEQGGGYPPM